MNTKSDSSGLAPDTPVSERHEGSEPLGAEHFHLLEAALGYTFIDKQLLERALTHRSVPSSGTKHDYERLEYLGDAVLDLGVADLLLEGHPDSREGDLSKMRAALVNATTLADVARSFGLGAYIRLSRGELANNGSDRPSILSDVLEAIFGAIYRDSSFDRARDCVRRLFSERVKNVIPQDPKTELQERLHALGSGAPEYVLECVDGPEHAPTFISCVQVSGQCVGKGRGTTKKASQQAAAAEALEKLNHITAAEQAALKEKQ